MGESSGINAEYGDNHSIHNESNCIYRDQTKMRGSDIVLAFSMLISGTVNTIAAKFTDSISVQGVKSLPVHEFNHPAVQTWAMFIGEFLCLLVHRVVLCWNYGKPANKYSQIKEDAGSHASIQFKTNQPKSFPFYIFWLPALCDMTATTLMYVGLTFTYPSVYQMLRGILVVFTGILSMIFLGRKLRAYNWVGIFLIIFGTAIVGLSSVLHKTGTAPRPLLGDILVVAAQLVAAVQMVLEEKLIGKYNVPPLQVVGFEGMFGFLTVTVVLTVGYFIPQFKSVDDTYDAMLQIVNSWQLVATLAGSIISIAILNFSGISITKYLSATHRTTIDACRVFLVWIFSLIIKWEQFDYIQLIGFAVLLSGTSLYNEIVRIPKLFQYDFQVELDEKEKLVQ
eukprot:TRINITY_DN3150_c0_g1_i1.p2 TRINITY_DN3150_c0_g1~~TRINITY_DN3150_c0_g1_i1.p2  ORF type:complete len:395 (+),score=62.28 TRINITY_DN3150_c0_g1_i1:17-1201(+)